MNERTNGATENGFGNRTSNSPMQLFSKQGVAVSDLAQHEPDSRSSGHKAEITQHYPRLFKMLGTARFIWCQTEPPDEWELKKSRKVARWWKLEVPPEGIVKFVDVVSWERIVGTCGNTRRLTKSLDNQADRESRRFDELNHEFWASLNIEDCWNSVLRDDDQSEWGVAPLVSAPLQKNWIIDTL